MNTNPEVGEVECVDEATRMALSILTRTMFNIEGFRAERTIQSAQQWVAHCEAAAAAEDKTELIRMIILHAATFHLFVKVYHDLCPYHQGHAQFTKEVLVNRVSCMPTVPVASSVEYVIGLDPERGN